MNLTDAKKLAPIYADGELAPTERRELERIMAVSPEIQADVSRWRELRQRVNDALRSEPVPAGLALRVESRLAAERLRVHRLRALPIVSVLGAAAAVGLAVFIWPSPAASSSLSPERFAKAFEMCGKGGHNTLNISNDELAARRELDALRPYAVAVPDLRSDGYFVHGACECVGHGEFNVTQVGYATHESQPHYLSLFSLDKRYALEPAANPTQLHAARNYQFAQVGGVGVLEWTESGGTFVIAGEMPATQLTELAGSFVVSTVDESLRSLANVGIR